MHGNSNIRFWCSYIIFIIIIGGILVLFIYTRRLASNEIFWPSNKIHRELGRTKDLSASRYFGMYLKEKKESHDKPQQILSFPFPSGYSGLASPECKYSALTLLQLLCTIIFLGIACCYLVEVITLQDPHTAKRQSAWKRLTFPQTKLRKVGRMRWQERVRDEA